MVSIIHCSGHLSSHWLRACFKFWISGNRSSYLLADIFSVLRSNLAIIISTMHCPRYGSSYRLRACSNDWISGDLSSYLLVDHDLLHDLLLPHGADGFFLLYSDQNAEIGCTQMFR